MKVISEAMLKAFTTKWNTNRELVELVPHVGCNLTHYFSSIMTATFHIARFIELLSKFNAISPWKKDVTVAKLHFFFFL